jgi:hypothetical protein
MNSKVLKRLSEDTIFATHILLSNKKNVSSRQVYDLSLFFGDVGGTYGSILVIFSIIASIFSSKLAVVKKAELFFKVS